MELIRPMKEKGQEPGGFGRQAARLTMQRISSGMEALGASMSMMIPTVCALPYGLIWNRISFNLKYITFSELRAGEADENNCNK